MNQNHPSEPLAPRDREILKDVIRTFILTGEPVSSRLVAKHDQHGVSSATIRNTMADLEERGLLSQPHSSAGRIPTSAGYHVYVEELMRQRRLPDGDRRRIERELEAGTGEEIMSAASQLLSGLSEQIGIVLTPALGETVMRSIDFVPLSGDRLLCVLVSMDGFVDQKVIAAGEPMSREELVRVGNYLSENFRGLTVREIRARLLRRMAEERASVDRILAQTIQLADRALGHHDGPDVLVEGTSIVLHNPELADVERVRRLLDTFADKARLVGMLGRLLEGRGVRVLIGEDSDLTSELDFSLVTASYGVGDRPLGTLGIFGPSRMDYQRIVPLVDYLGERVSLALEATISDVGAS